MAKVLKGAASDDTVTLRAADNPDTVTFMFETSGKERLAEYEMKLINMDQEHLGIPVKIYCSYFRINFRIFNEFNML